MGLFIAYFFACLWFYFPDRFNFARSWLERYSYKVEPVFDKLVASLYFVYATVSTTGYGDIVPSTATEFFLAFIFMSAGVTFYSLVYSTIIAKMEQRRNESEEIATKRGLLRSLKDDDKLFPKDNVDIYNEMLQHIETYRLQVLNNEVIPKFKHIRPMDLDQLNLETCQMLHRFGEIIFFKNLSPDVWLEFSEVMEQKVYLPGDRIVTEGLLNKKLFVIKRGKVWLITSSIDDQNYPFMEVDSHFGACEASEGLKNGWNIIAKEKSVIFSFEIDDVRRILTKAGLWEAFINNESERLEKMIEANNKSGENIMRLRRLQLRMSSIKKQTVAQIQGELEKINFDPKDNSGWEKVANLFKSNKVNKPGPEAYFKSRENEINSPTQSLLLGSRDSENGAFSIRPQALESPTIVKTVVQKKKNKMLVVGRQRMNQGSGAYKNRNERRAMSRLSPEMGADYDGKMQEKESSKHK